jgi:hypothetical protein
MQESIFTHGLFRNTVTVYGTAVSVAVMIIIVYAPFLQVTAVDSLCGGWRSAQPTLYCSAHICPCSMAAAAPSTFNCLQPNKHIVFN